MTRFHRALALLITVGGGLAFSACEREQAQETARARAEENGNGDADSVAGVQRETVAPVAQPTNPIEVQPGPEGSQVALDRVAVTGDVLTVQTRFTGGSGYAYIEVDEVSVIDDASAQRLGVLRDANGQWLAAPLDSGKERLRLRLVGGEPVVAWFKFPAPPPGTQTVSVNIPKVGPFDGIPVAR